MVLGVGLNLAMLFEYVPFNFPCFIPNVQFGWLSSCKLLKTYWYCFLCLEYFSAFYYLLNSISLKSLHLLHQEFLGLLFNLDRPLPSLCPPAALNHSSIILLGAQFCDFPKQVAHFHQWRRSPSLARSKHLIAMNGERLNERTPEW